MESDTAATSHKNRVSHEMIQIYEHGKHNYNIGAKKIFTEK